MKPALPGAPRAFDLAADAASASAAQSVLPNSSPAALPVLVHVQSPDGVDCTLPAAPGATLFSVLKPAGLVQGICGGNMSCGTCRILPDATWSHRLPAAGRGELRLLASLDDATEADRLACQIVMQPELSGLSVTLYPPEW
ncbi:MAG: hypothetical protein V4724_10480 [Pseudomonadota bacterium]